MKFNPPKSPRVDWPATYALRRTIAESVAILAKIAAEDPSEKAKARLIDKINQLDAMVVVE